jgi:hypothetical protein
MKELALEVFRRPPDRLNCAQSVLHAWHEVVGATGLQVADLRPFGAGRAPEGLCGAVYAACLLAPDRSEELKVAFATRLGSLCCKEIRAAKVHSCAGCVEQAAELLAEHLPRESLERPAESPICDPNMNTVCDVEQTETL